MKEQTKEVANPGLSDPNFTRDKFVKRWVSWSKDFIKIAGSQHALQSLHSLFCFGAGQARDVAPNQGWSLVITLEELGHESGARWSTMGALNRMTKLLGLSVRWSLIHASRVGNQ